MSNRSGQPVVEIVAKRPDRLGQPVLERVKNSTLNTHRLELFWTNRASKSSPTARRRSGDTKSRLIMAVEMVDAVDDLKSSSL